MSSSKANRLSKEQESHGTRKNDSSPSKDGTPCSNKSTDMSCSYLSLSALVEKRSVSKIIDTGHKLPGGTPSQSSSEERQQEQMPSSIRKRNQNGPWSKLVWKGNFEIKDSPREMRCCESILAHLSAKVSRRAYSFTKQLAGVLQFVVYAQNQILPHIFGSHRPSRDDIALYFYPSKSERSKRQYSLLLKFMERKAFMLRSRIGAIELLVIPSTLLDGESRKLDGHYFMWGVFHRIKVSKSIRNAASQSSSLELEAVKM